MAKIESIESPGSAPDLASLMPPTTRLTLSSAARDFKTQRWTRKAAGLAVAGLALFVMLNGMGWGFFILIPAGVLFFGEVSGLGVLHQQRAKAQSDWKSALENWHRTSGSERFRAKKDGLLNTAASYRALPTLEKEMLHKVELNKRELQMRKHLERRKLNAASIDSIGDGRKLTLRSFGIESAWDVNATTIMAVPGFVPIR
jgi:hypothetical protein